MSDKFKIVTLGCRTNQYESAAYQNQLTQMGYQIAQGDDRAQVCIVNTCTVTESADSHSRHAIRQLQRENPDAKIIVTGCLAERKPEMIKNMGVSLVVSNKDKEKLLSQVFPEADIPEFSITHFEAHTRAFVKVQDGCNSYCSYCIIPFVRGRSRSRSVDDILREVRELIRNGYKEIVLTGINIGDFDGNQDPPVRLADLVRAVDKVEGLQRLRVSSIDPDEVDEDLADAILNGRVTCPSMHLVLQSGSNLVLKRMNRKYTRSIFHNTVDKMREADPDFTVTTDIIVGFPGETDQDFEETLTVMREVKFAKVHMFPFSERERTRAAIMPNKVSPEIIRERKQTVLQLAEQTAFDLRQRFIGRTMSVLIEQSDGGNARGHTTNFLSVILPHTQLPANTLCDVVLLENSPEGLISKCVSR